MYTYKDAAVIWMTAITLMIAIVMTGGMPGVVAFAQEESPEGPPPYAEASYYSEATYYAEGSYQPVDQQQGADGSNPNENDGVDGSDGLPQDQTVENGENGEAQDGGTPAENGESGDDANAPQDPPATTDGSPAQINTGNASTDSTTTNTGNMTDVTTPEPEGTKYPYGKPPPWVIKWCETHPGPKCDKFIVKPPPTTVQVTDDIVMENEAEAISETGENKAVDPDGVSITTGNADGFGYLISLFNVVVTNSTGSILFLKNPLADALDFTQRIMSIFANLAGADSDCDFSGCTLSDAVFNLITDDSAEVSNELIVRSDTGANAATSTDGIASIDTGNANAFGSIVNFGNLQIVDSRYLIILMSNQGNLSGNIVLPDQEFFRSLSTGAKFGPNSSFNASNTADVTNDGTANAVTGSNSAAASSTQEQAQIQTGQANSDSTAINFVNQIGSPICFIVNVGGRWRGDVVRLPEGFSREKTEFGEVICGAGTNADRPGARSNFHATTTNYAKVLNKAIVEATTGANSAVGAAARIKTGNADAFLQILNVLNQSIVGQDWIFALFTVSGNWDGNMVFGADQAASGGSSSDDILTQIAAQMLAGAAAGGGSPGGYTSEPKLSVVKSASVASASLPAKVDYKVVVKNDKGGGVAYRARLSDVMVEPAKGTKIFSRSWNLGTIKEGEEITLSYTVEFDGGIPRGIYENTATVTGYRNESIYVLPNPFEPVSAMAKVEISGGEVLGIEAGPTCTPLLKGYIQIGKKNVPEDVRNLQTFLLVSEGEQIGASGIYDEKTIAAVKRFQQKYHEYILDPWGISMPTGNVYYTTQHTINNMYCKGGTFPLSESQVSEINSFKTNYQDPSQPKPDPVSAGIGKAAPKKPKAQATLDMPKMIPFTQITPLFVPISKNGPHNNGLSGWMKKMMPFVEASN
ncbi:hypothetical protein HY969_04675 [Candidatus Kaiserbacteria bacterium]|nr:hypothetical protein [Candidatus Kaiserbacteria bacterium]